MRLQRKDERADLNSSRSQILTLCIRNSNPLVSLVGRLLRTCTPAHPRAEEEVDVTPVLPPPKPSSHLPQTCLPNLPSVRYFGPEALFGLPPSWLCSIETPRNKLVHSPCRSRCLSSPSRRPICVTDQRLTRLGIHFQRRRKIGRGRCIPSGLAQDSRQPPSHSSSLRSGS